MLGGVDVRGGAELWLRAACREGEKTMGFFTPVSGWTIIRSVRVFEAQP
jgi:hypothetical protein